MFIVAWSRVKAGERIVRNWSIIDGKDAMDVFVQELIESGVSDEDIVSGEVLDN